MRKKLWYKKEATSFNEALPLGNGRLGAMIYGGAFIEKISLNEDTLWSGQPTSAPRMRSLDELSPIRELISERQYKQAEKQLSELMYGTHSEAYMPAGSLYIETELDGAVSDYRRSLDLSEALVCSSFTANGKHFRREAFACAPANTLAYRITCSRRANYKLYAKCPLRSRLIVCADGIDIDGVCPTSVDMFKRAVEYDDKKESIGFAVRVRVKTDGACMTCGDTLQVVGATELTVYTSVSTSFNGYNKAPMSEGREYVCRCLDTVERARALPYDTLRGEHIEDYKRLFDRVYLELGEVVDKPTDERIASADNDPQLTELLFDYGKYLLISSSREGTQPANLQGIWNEHIIPPWNSNYTMNINTQMNYWHAEQCGLGECHLPFIAMLGELCEKGNTWGLEGFASWHNSDIWRYNSEATAQPVWGFWQMGGFWGCRHIWEHYRYTLDKEFLGEAVHILTSACDFLLGWMITDAEGHYTTSPSTSPENSFVFNGEPCCVTEGTAMDLSICKELFGITAKALRELGMDGEVYEMAEKKIKPLSVGADGRLLEWNEQFEEFEKGHRHLSHLYGIYPSDVIERGSELYAAARRSLDYRVSYSEQNNTYMGWSNAWKACLYAEFGDSEALWACITAMFKDSLYPNMLDKHPPFQIDGNFGICAAICNMIVDQRGEATELLRALPKVFERGVLLGVRLYGNKKANVRWERGAVTEWTVTDVE